MNFRALGAKFRFSPGAISRQIYHVPLPRSIYLRIRLSTKAHARAGQEMAAIKAKKPRQVPPFITVSTFPGCVLCVASCKSLFIRLLLDRRRRPWISFGALLHSTTLRYRPGLCFNSKRIHLGQVLPDTRTHTVRHSVTETATDTLRGFTVLVAHRCRDVLFPSRARCFQTFGIPCYYIFLLY